MRGTHQSKKTSALQNIRSSGERHAHYMLEDNYLEKHVTRVVGREYSEVLGIGEGEAALRKVFWVNPMK